MTHTSEKTESLRRYDQYTSITLTDVRGKMTEREKKGEERETDRQTERERVPSHLRLRHCSIRRRECLFYLL